MLRGYRVQSFRLLGLRVFRFRNAGSGVRVPRFAVP